MAPCEITDDYYAILEVPQSATIEIIRKSYLRLAVLLHPDKNPHKPDATASFQRLSTAYITVSDPEKRQVYDIQWIRINHRRTTEEESRKCQAEEKLKRQKEQRASQERLQQWERLRCNYESDIFEANRVIRQLAAGLKNLRDQDDQELKKERERNGWWAYFTSPVYGRAEETKEQKQQRESERLQRLASARIKENDLNQREAKLQSLKSVLQDVNSKIAAERIRNENEARVQAAKMQEQLRKEQAAKRRSEEELQERERQARWDAARRQEQLRKEQAAKRRFEEEQQERERWDAARRQEQLRKEQAAKKRFEEEQQERERQARWDAARRQEQLRKEQEARKRSEEERERRAKWEEAAARAAKQARDVQEASETQKRARVAEPARRKNQSKKPATAFNSTYRASPSASKNEESTCRHDNFWPKVQGSHRCDNCHTNQKHFAFQCPGCKMIACANCRQGLRGERGKKP